MLVSEATLLMLIKQQEVSIEQCFIEKLFPEMGKKFTSNTDEIHVSEIQVAADQPHSDNTQVETITLI